MAKIFIDFHTHKPLYKSNNQIVEVVSAHESLKYPEALFTIGHHPWWNEKPLSSEQLKALADHLSLPNCLALGECGLDKLKGAPKAIQEKAFYQQIKLANELNAPMIIHCVRQYDQVLKFKKLYGKTPWVIHGFRRNKLLAKSLLDAGIKLSISPFENMNLSFTELLAYLPLSEIFIETDSEYSLTIIDRYQILATLRNVELTELQLVMYRNFLKFFAWKSEILNQF